MTDRTAGTPGPLTALSEEEHLFRQSVREFAEQVVRPRVRQMDAEAAIPPDLVASCFDIGLMGLEIPDALGGAGGRFFHAILAVEQLSRVDASVGLLVDVQNTLVVNAIRRWAAPEVAADLLPRLARTTVGAYALSEAGAGSDAFALETRATPQGDGFVLTGRKRWITNAHEAGLFLVFATVDPAAGHRGITAFAVDRHTPGLVVGRKEDKLGLRASSTCEVHFDGCYVAGTRLLGEVGRGYKVAMDTLNDGRIGIGAQMAGLAAGALDRALAYVRAREQFGQPLAAFQGVQFQLARAAADLEAARLLVYNAARLREAGASIVTEAAMAKLVASETAERIASLAVNLHGAAGVVTDGLIEKYYRDAKIGQIYEGASNLLLQAIAKHLLRP